MLLGCERSFIFCCCGKLNSRIHNFFRLQSSRKTLFRAKVSQCSRRLHHPITTSRYLNMRLSQMRRRACRAVMTVCSCETTEAAAAGFSSQQEPSDRSGSGFFTDKGKKVSL